MNKFKIFLDLTGLAPVKFSNKYMICYGTVQQWVHGRRTMPDYVLNLFIQSEFGKDWNIESLIAVHKLLNSYNLNLTDFKNMLTHETVRIDKDLGVVVYQDLISKYAIRIKSLNLIKSNSILTKL